MKNSLLIALTGIFLFWSKQMQAQQPAFYHLSTAEGLSDNNVTTAIRDKNGILWIGTSEGLNSFDGNRITTYHKYSHPELPDNHVERIVVDRENRVWLRTNTRYITMLDQKRKFHRILVGNITDSSNINAIFLSATRGVVVLKGREHFFQKKENPFEFEKINVPFNDSLAGRVGFTYYLDNDRVIYYRGENLVVVDYKQLKVLLRIPFPGLSGANYINDDELIAFTLKGDIFYRISILEKKIKKEYRNVRDQHQLPITGNLRNMTRIDEDHFAFTSFYSGIYVLDLKNESLQHFSHDPIDPRSIGGDNTFNVIYDSSGYLFVTTQTSGLHFYNIRQQQATSKPYFIDAEKKIFDGYIQSLLADDQANVWMGAQDRLIKWDRRTGRTKYVPLRLKNGLDLSGSETIRAIDMDENGNLWAGTTRHGILVLNKKQELVRHITDSVTGKRTTFPSPWINAMCTDKKGNRWIGTLRGTCIIPKNSFEIISLKGHKLLGQISETPCASLFRSDDGSIWIGTISGVWCYSEERDSLLHYTVKDGLLNNTVSAINQDLLGNTYFASTSGLSILSKHGKIRNYNRSNGLRNDRCEGILKDENGYIWIGNLGSILRYDPANETFAVFEEGLGFSHAGFRMRSCYKSKDGEMFWGTDRGLVYFYPDKMNISSFPLKPSVSSLQVGDSVYRFTKKEDLSFAYNTSSFIFNFSSTELSGKKDQLLYRLIGYDDKWRTPASKGQVAFSKLRPGDYRFEIKASRDGVTWFHGAYPVFITVNKPWWQTWWWRSIVIAYAAVVAYFAYRYFRKRKEAREVQKMIGYFTNSGYEYSSVNDILWDICRNCISHLHFEDCVIYLLDDDRNVLVQKAAYGPKNPNGFEILNPIEIPVGKGIVGNVAATGSSSVIHDTSKDDRYIVDDEPRYSEITVPLVHEGRVIGVIDSEHRKKNFFSPAHLNALQSIAAICAVKISRAMAIDAMKRNEKALMELNVKMAESKFLNLRLQMNPHFLFNSLSSIQHLIVSKQTTKAYKYLTIFSNFLRSLLNYAEKNFIPLDEEVRILSMYVELESLRFDESFHYEIQVDENLSNDVIFVPSLMIQPFAENAIWHGLLHKEGEKRLIIRFAADSGETLHCIIEDNGIGRDKAATIKNNNISAKVHESKGIYIIKERLELLQQKTRKPATMNFEDVDPSGTRVTINIPYYNPEEI